MIKAVIIDDEADSIETLQWKLNNYCPQVEVVATFEDPVKGLQYLKKNSPQLLFLDIEMPMLSGFDVLEELGSQIPFDVIFTTAYSNFGIQAIKASALDYLLKPVQNKELVKALDKFDQKNNVSHRQEQLEGLLVNIQAEKTGRKGKIALATKESIEFVDAEDIICCNADSNYTLIYLSDGRKKIISKTLKEFEEILLPFNFYRAHNSYLVNLAKIKMFMRADGGYLVMINKMKVPVAKNRKEGLLNLI